MTVTHPALLPCPSHHHSFPGSMEWLPYPSPNFHTSFPSIVNTAGRVTPLKWKSDHDAPLFKNLQRFLTGFRVKIQASPRLTRLHILWSSVSALTCMLLAPVVAVLFLFLRHSRSLLLQRFGRLSAWNAFLADIYKTKSPSLHSGLYSNVTFSVGAFSDTL